MQNQKAHTGELGDDYVYTPKKSVAKQHIVLDSASTESVSINSFLYFYENLCKTRFHLHIIDVDFPHLVENAKNFGLVQRDLDKLSKNGETFSPFRCLTNAGTPCIQICVDEEPNNHAFGKKFWDLKKALVALVTKKKLHALQPWKRSNCDIFDNKGISLLVRAIKNKKYQSLKILLEDGEANPSFPNDTKVERFENSAYSEAII